MPPLLPAGGVTGLSLGGGPSHPPPGVASTQTSTLLDAIASGWSPGPGLRAFSRCQPAWWKVTVAVPSAPLTPPSAVPAAAGWPLPSTASTRAPA